MPTAKGIETRHLTASNPGTGDDSPNREQTASLGTHTPEHVDFPFENRFASGDWE